MPPINTAALIRESRKRTRAEMTLWLRNVTGQQITAADFDRIMRKHLPLEAHFQTEVMTFLRDNYPGSFVWKAAAGPYSRQGIPDYLVTMRKPGENPGRVTHTNESFPVRVWQQYASPIWTDINPSDTLQYKSARENEDERHICPLQLTVIRRGIELWTNKNDIVLTPFMGIGSEAYMAVKMNRRAVGIELKDSYYRQAVLNVKEATHERQPDLFDFLQPTKEDAE